jgi:hypothetical protein
MFACSADRRPAHAGHSALARVASAEVAMSSAHDSRWWCAAVSSPNSASRAAANWRMVSSNE